MGNLRSAANDFPMPTRLMEMNDPTSEVDRIVERHNELLRQRAIEAMKKQHFVPDWRLRFRED